MAGHGSKPTRVQIASYNTNLQGNAGLPQDLVDWLDPTLDATVKFGPCDIVAVGFQELLPLHLGFTGRSRGVVDSRNALILKEIQTHVGAEYSLVARAVNVGVALLVYAKDEGIGRMITDVQTSWSGCGPLWLGNKGAVGIRFTVKASEEGEVDEVFTFVNVHLTAHTHNLQQRVEDYKHIVRTLIFSPKTAPTIYDTTHLFVFGDLNFRLLPKEGLDVNAKLLTPEGRRELAALDELSAEMRKGAVCQGLYEGNFSEFKPTYKYELGSVDQYSTKRVQAWTDRILFMTNSDAPNALTSNISPLLYTSVPSYTTSDHKPIVAILDVPHASSTGPTVVAPFEPATFLYARLYTGKVFAWIIGWSWCLLRLIGMGRATVGLWNAVVGLGALAWWKRTS